MEEKRRYRKRATVLLDMIATTAVSKVGDLQGSRGRAPGSFSPHVMIHDGHVAVSQRCTLRD